MGMESIPVSTPLNEEKSKSVEKTFKKLEGKERQEFLEKVYNAGRAAFHTHMSEEMGSLTRNAKGWQVFPDNKEESQNANTKGLFHARRESLRGDPRPSMEKENVDGMLKLRPLVNEIPQYEEKEEIIKKGFFKKPEILKTRVLSGYKKEAELLSSYTNDQKDAVPAYELYYHHLIKGGKMWTNDDRPGKSFDAKVVLNQEFASELIEFIKNDPSLLNELLSKFIDPEVKKYMDENGGFPEDKRILVGSEEDEGFVRDNSREKNITGIKEQFIFGEKLEKK